MSKHTLTLRFNLANETDKLAYTYLLDKASQEGISQNRFIINLIVDKACGKNDVIDTQVIVQGIVDELVKRNIAIGSVSQNEEKEFVMVEDDFNFIG